MTEHLLGFFLLGSLLGMLLASFYSLAKGSEKTAPWLMAFFSAFGAFGGFVYFWKYAGTTISLIEFDSFFGLRLSFSYLSALFFTLVCGICTLVLVYSRSYLQHYKETYHIRSVQFLTGIFIFGMQGVLLAQNSIGFLLFWEMMSMASFFLVMADRSSESIKAAFLYFIMTHLGAGALLAGFMVLGNGALSFDFSHLGEVVGTLSSGKLLLAFFLFLFGFGSKAGLVPFHVWLPEAHPQAPSHISALMSGLMLKVAVYGFVMINLSFSGLPSWAAVVVLCLGLISAIIGVIYAFLERDIKRALAYSSIENMGVVFLMLGVALYLRSIGGEAASLSLIFFVLALFHSVNHALFKTGLFLSAGTIIHAVHSRSLDAMGGLAKLFPLFSGAFLILILGASALPPFGTFFGEWGFIQNIVGLLRLSHIENTSLAILLLSLSVIAFVGGLAIFAMVRIFAFSMLGLPRSDYGHHHTKTDWISLFPILILSTALVGTGLFARPIMASFLKHIAFTDSSIGQKVGNFWFSSALLFSVLIFFVVCSYGIRRIFSNKKFERAYHPWDCGQPINATMEYTATAFSGPLRFFFRFLTRIRKSVESKPLVETNPWIRKTTFSLSIHSIWFESLYAPVGKVLLFIASKVRSLQSGRIQLYIFFVFLTLIVSLIIAL